MPFTERSQANEFYADILSDAEKQGQVHSVLADLGRRDLFFLLCKLLNRPDVDRDWLFDRCIEVQAAPDGYLDLWAREHYKSTIITFAKTIQDILCNPETTVGIFSHTRPIAKKFLWQIKSEMETNTLLKEIYPDVLWSHPAKESPLWSLDSGIVVRRKLNPKEATVEAWGLVDGQPTSKHFALMVYDDVVTMESVSNPEMIAKVTDRWAISLNLGAAGGKRRTIGTRYHLFDTYEEMMKRETVKPRIYPARDKNREPVLLTEEVLQEKRRDMGPHVYAAQMDQDPTSEEAQGFDIHWLRYYNSVDAEDLNIYLLCDPAGEKKRKQGHDPDYTVQLVIGLGPDRNYYLLDGIRDRLNLTGRTKSLIHLHRKWQPIATGYEKYGKDSDIEHIEDEQERMNYRFPIIPLGGAMPKNDRIRRLVPLFERSRIYLPHRLLFIDGDGKTRDLVRELIEDEYVPFPVCKHDDMLDDLARILDPDMEADFPEYRTHQEWMVEKNQTGEYDPFARA